MGGASQCPFNFDLIEQVTSVPLNGCKTVVFDSRIERVAVSMAQASSLDAFLRLPDVLPARANPEREYLSRRGPTGSAPISY